MGGPDGGDGGKGGDVWLVADRNTSSLLPFRDHPHRSAANGVHGKGKKCHGKTGRDEIVKVPVGTVVHDHGDGSILADLATDGARWLAAEGGRGGRGNARFLSNRMRAPAFAEQGEVGEEQWLSLELKLNADVALVGLPNVGKSTLISVISAAKPKIADYHFTTLVPNLGVVRFDDTDFVVADVPGLIEGASEGKGLGHRFLRHIERARVLVVLLDLSPAAGYTPDEQLDVLLTELGSYQPQLLERPRIVVGSKSDIAGDVDFDGPVISSVTRSGTRELVAKMATAVVEARKAEPADEGYVVHRPRAEGVLIERHDNGVFEVHGRDAHRAVALSDLTDLDALGVAQGRLKKLGVDRALARAGARRGDIVQIGDMSFEYADDDLVWESDDAPGWRE